MGINPINPALQQAMYQVPVLPAAQDATRMAQPQFAAYQQPYALAQEKKESIFTFKNALIAAGSTILLVAGVKTYNAGKVFEKALGKNTIAKGTEFKTGQTFLDHLNPINWTGRADAAKKLEGFTAVNGTDGRILTNGSDVVIINGKKVRNVKDFKEFVPQKDVPPAKPETPVEENKLPENQTLAKSQQNILKNNTLEELVTIKSEDTELIKKLKKFFVEKDQQVFLDALKKRDISKLQSMYKDYNKVIHELNFDKKDIPQVEKVEKFIGDMLTLIDDTLYIPSTNKAIIKIKNILDKKGINLRVQEGVKLQDVQKVQSAINQLESKGYKAPTNIRITDTVGLFENASGKALMASGQDTIMLNSKQKIYPMDYALYHETGHIINAGSRYKTKNQVENIVSQVSEYALSGYPNLSEFSAEVFAGLMTNRQFKPEVFNLYKEINKI